MINSALMTLGLMKKAGKLEAGEEPCGAACRAGHAKAVLLAVDAAENTVRRAGHFAGAGNAPLIVTPFTKDDLGSSIGRTSCAMMAICDIGFASMFVSKLAEADGQYAAAAEELREKAGKTEQRNREMKKHGKRR